MSAETTTNEERRAEYRLRPWERHMQTILSALVLGGIMWLANTTSETARQIAVMETRMSSLDEQYKDLKRTLELQEAKYASRFELVTLQKALESLQLHLDSIERQATRQ